MQLPKKSSTDKQLSYELAAAIERRSGHRLVAAPCLGGNGIAISDGRAIHFVEPSEISSPEALIQHIKIWLAQVTKEPSLHDIEQTPEGARAKDPITADKACNPIRDENTLRPTPGDLESPGRSAVELKLAAMSKSKPVLHASGSRHPLVSRAYLVRETIKELEHEL